jgi:predicted transcriptional regulator
MPESLEEMVRQDMQCESLLECFHGMGNLEKRVFSVLVESAEPLTIDEIAERVDRERSTTYRAVRRLREAGFLQREQVNYENGGYYHIFEPVDADVIATEMQQLLNEWYAQMGQLIGDFREKYDERTAPAES